jgi:hypothetical protein
LYERNHTHLTIKGNKKYIFIIFLQNITPQFFHRFFLADDEDAGLRRISYIKATKEDRIQAGIDSDDFEDEIILGIEHDYDINNSGEFSVPVSSTTTAPTTTKHKFHSFSILLSTTTPTS